MEPQPWNLLDEALGLGGTNQSAEPLWPLSGRVLLVEDCVETSGSFVLHHLLKRALSPQWPSSAVVFIAFSQPFPHYERILRKLGCNLAVQRDNNRFVFLEMVTLECPDGAEDGGDEHGLAGLYGKVQKAIRCLIRDGKNSVTIMIDDVSLMEVAAKGLSDRALNFLHYCHTLTSEYGCLLATLNHEDIYLSTDRPSVMIQMEYLSDIVIKTQPLATGLATDVHGQLTVLRKGINDIQGSSRNKISNFHFKIKENSIDYFYPGSRT